jgi:hypothetical protein
MGGSDDSSNIVRLTAKEHYIAHHLLWKHHKLSKLAHAWFSMLRRSNGQERHFTASEYERCRLVHSKVMKETMLGNGNHFYGLKHTDECKHRMREMKLGKKSSLETRAKQSMSLKGKRKTEDHKAKIGRKGLIMLKNVITGETIRLDKADSLVYDPDIWKNPFKIASEQSDEIYECVHCKFTSKNKQNIIRWHNDNCKYKESGIYIDTARLRKTGKRKIPVTINNKQYSSLRQAGIDLNLTQTQVRKLLNETKVD